MKAAYVCVIIVSIFNCASCSNSIRESTIVQDARATWDRCVDERRDDHNWYVACVDGLAVLLKERHRVGSIDMLISEVERLSPAMESEAAMNPASGDVHYFMAIRVAVARWCVDNGDVQRLSSIFRHTVIHELAPHVPTELELAVTGAERGELAKWLSAIPEAAKNAAREEVSREWLSIMNRAIGDQVEVHLADIDGSADRIIAWLVANQASLLPDIEYAQRIATMLSEERPLHLFEIR